MKIPDTIRINGIDYAVVMRDSLDDGQSVLCGRIDNLQNVIELSSRYGYQSQCVTFWHECLHGIEYINGLQLGEDKEKIIDTFAYGVYQILQDNGGKLFDLQSGRAMPAPTEE